MATMILTSEMIQDSVIFDGDLDIKSSVKVIAGDVKARVITTHGALEIKGVLDCQQLIYPPDKRPTYRDAKLMQSPITVTEKPAAEVKVDPKVVIKPEEDPIAVDVADDAKENKENDSAAMDRLKIFADAVVGRKIVKCEFGVDKEKQKFVKELVLEGGSRIGVGALIFVNGKITPVVDFIKVEPNPKALLKGVRFILHKVRT